jgi:hypothetical protein
MKLPLGCCDKDTDAHQAFHWFPCYFSSSLALKTVSSYGEWNVSRSYVNCRLRPWEKSGAILQPLMLNLYLFPLYSASNRASPMVQTALLSDGSVSISQGSLWHRASLLSYDALVVWTTNKSLLYSETRSLGINIKI